MTQGQDPPHLSPQPQDPSQFTPQNRQITLGTRGGTVARLGGQESVTRSARSSARVGRMWVDEPHWQLLLSACMLAIGVGIDDSLGMGED